MAALTHPEAGIEQLLHAENELLPPRSLVENARLKNYEAEYRRSVEDPEAFWAEAARELEWFQPWNKVFDWTYPTFEWFQGGKCNITYNCLDRQVKSGHVWLSIPSIRLPKRQRREQTQQPRIRPMTVASLIAGVLSEACCAVLDTLLQNIPQWQTTAVPSRLPVP